MRQRRMTAAVGALAVLTALAATAAAQAPNPRFGKWRLKSDNPPPASNVMTYEPFGDGGMKVTVESVGASGNASQWGYTTMFDGKDYPVTGSAGADAAAVRIINDKINEIIYKKNGKVTQLLINVLSADNNTITVTYIRTNAQGVTSTTYATYERLKG